MYCAVKDAMVNDNNRQMIFRISMLSLMPAGVSPRAQAGRGPAMQIPEVSIDGEVTPPCMPGAKAVTGIGLQPNLYTGGFSADGATLNHPCNPRYKMANAGSGQSTT